MHKLRQRNVNAERFGADPKEEDMAGKCPKCEKSVSRVTVEHINITEGIHVWNGVPTAEWLAQQIARAKSQLAPNPAGYYHNVIQAVTLVAT